MKIAELLEAGPIAINVGVRDFARDLEDQQVDVVQLDWRPPVREDEEVRRMLEQLL